MNAPGWLSDPQLASIRWRLAEGLGLDPDDQYLLGLHIVQQQMHVPDVARSVLQSIFSCRSSGRGWFQNRTATFLAGYPSGILGELIVEQDKERVRDILSSLEDRRKAIISQITTNLLIERHSRFHDRSVIQAMDEIEGANWYDEEVLLTAVVNDNMLWVERMLRTMPSSPSPALLQKLWKAALSGEFPDLLIMLCDRCRTDGIDANDGMDMATTGVEPYEKYITIILTTPASREQLSGGALFRAHQSLRSRRRHAVEDGASLAMLRQSAFNRISKYDQIINLLNENVEGDERWQREYLKGMPEADFNDALISYFRTGHLSKNAPRISEETIIDVLNEINSISPKLLLAAVQEGNMSWFERLLPLASPLSPGDHQDLWREAICNPLPDTLNWICEEGLLPVQHTLTAGTSLSSSLQEGPSNALEFAVENSVVSAIITILLHANTRKQLSDTDIERAYQQAIVKGDADCAFELAKHLKVEWEGVALDLFIGRANGDFSVMPDLDHVKLRFHQVGYFTSVPVVSRWIRALTEVINASSLSETDKQLLLATIKEEKQDLLEWLPYVGRYVRFVDQLNVSKEYQAGATEMRDRGFIQRQRQHADNMRAQVVKRIDSGAFIRLEDSQQFYANARDSVTAFASETRPDYKETLQMYFRTPRHTDDSLLHTNFFNITRLIPHRYDSDYFIVRNEMVLQRQRDNVTQGIRILMMEGVREGEMYSLTYDGVELTTVLFDGLLWRWLHTQPKNIRDHWEKVEAIVSSLLAAPIGPRDAEWFASYKRQWLTVFWLSSNFCLFPRGSAQGTQNSLNEVCNRQQVPAPIARKEHPMLNTIAISLPLEEFLERIDEFIEPWELPLS